MPTNATAAIATREKRFMASPFPVLLLRMMRSVISFDGLGDRWRCLNHSARLVHVPALRNELLEDGRHRRYFVLTFRRLHLCDQISKFLIGSSHLRHHGRLLGHLLFVVGHVSLVPHHGSRTRSTLAEVVLVSGGRWRLSKDRGGAEDRYHQRDRWPHASDGRECFGSHGSPPSGCQQMTRHNACRALCCRLLETCAITGATRNVQRDVPQVTRTYSRVRARSCL